MLYKIICPAGYSGTNEIDDNIDINVVTEGGDVFYAALFTPQNFVTLFARNGGYGMWSPDMIVVKDLAIPTIRKAIDELIERQYFEDAFDKIGTIAKIYGEAATYEGLVSIG